MYQPAFAVIVKGLMRKQQMNPTQLATRCGYSRSYVAKLIKGQTVPTLDAAHEVLRALEANLSHILYQIELHEDRVARGEALPVTLAQLEKPKVSAEAHNKSVAAAKVRARRLAVPVESFLSEAVSAGAEPGAFSEALTEEQQAHTARKLEQLPPEPRARELATPAAAKVDPVIAALNPEQLLALVDLQYLPTKAQGLPIEGETT